MIKECPKLGKLRKQLKICLTFSIFLRVDKWCGGDTAGRRQSIRVESRAGCIMGVDGRARQEEQKLQEASAPQCSSPCPPCPTPCPPCPAPPYPAPSLPGKPPTISMQDGSDRSIKNGALKDKDVDNGDTLQEGLYTRPKLEAGAGCRRSSLRECPSTPPPPPPPSSGAPVWERRPRVKTFNFHLDKAENWENPHFGFFLLTAPKQIVGLFRN